MNKKIFLLAICSLLTVCSFAQNDSRVKRENKREKSTFSSKHNNATDDYSQLRTSAIQKQLSSIEDNHSKYEYTYDANGNMLTETSYRKENNAWVKSYKYEYTYDTNGSQLSHTQYYWENNTWENIDHSYNYEYTYDTNGNKLSEIEYRVWGNNLRENLYKYDYTHDTNGYILSEIRYIWENNTWTNYYKRKFTRAANGYILTETSWNWQNNTWVNEYKDECTYDANWNELSETSYTWENNTWVNDYKYEVTYDTKGNPLTGIEYSGFDNGWTNSYKSEYTHDANGNMLTEINYDGQDNTWIELSKYDYTHDINGNMLTEIQYLWENNTWVNEYKDEYTYDLSVLTSNTHYPINEGREYSREYSRFNNIILERKGYTWVNNSWQESEIKTLRYSDVEGSDIVEIPTAHFSVFPNPVAESLHIKGIETETPLTIWDMNGKAVIQKVVSSDEVISVSHLASGMYFVKTENQTIKIIKQ